MLFIFDKNQLVHRKVTNKAILLAILGVVVFSTYLSIFMSTQVYRTKILTEEARLIVMREENVFSKEKLKEYILQLNIKFPQIVLAQAELESGNFTSPIFKENHNFFGMKCAKLRPTTNKGENKGHAYFDTWRDCVVDYAFYSATYLNDIRSEAEYLDYLRQNYAEDPNYVDKVKQIIERNRE